MDGERLKILIIFLWIKGIIYNFSDKSIFKKLISIKEKELKKFLRKIDGHFAIVFEKITKLFVLLMKFLQFQYSIILIRKIFNYSISKFNKKINKIRLMNKFWHSMSSYTVGEQTIYNNFYRLRGGFYFTFNKKIKNLLN